MAILKHEIPILEFDSDTQAVIMPNHEKLPLNLPQKAIYAFTGESVNDFAISMGGIKVGEFDSSTKPYPIWVCPIDGEDVCVCQAPVGSAAAAQILDWLIGYGVRKVISTGSCGVLVDIPENTFLIPSRALRDEGASYHYLPPSRYVDISPAALRAIETALGSMGLACTECVTWSTDGFYRETRAKVEYRREEGCSVVEMECAALAAVAEMRGAIFGQILFTADSLATLDDYDSRDFGKASYFPALKLCAEVLKYM